MDPYRLPYDIRDALLCLVFLVGIGAGVFAIIRKRQMAGLLTVAGFLLFSVDPIAEMVIFRVITSGYTGDNFDVLNWSYVCISTPAMLLGVVALIAALFIAARPQTSEGASAL